MSIFMDGVEYVKKDLDSNYVIVRSSSSGVHAGYLVRSDGSQVVLKNARRIWYWEGAASLSQLAMEGTTMPETCKFPCEVDSIMINDVSEIINCTGAAKKSIKGVPVWNA